MKKAEKEHLGSGESEVCIYTDVLCTVSVDERGRGRLDDVCDPDG